MDDSKTWYTSRTIWVNLVALVASMLMVFGVELTPDQQGALVTTILAIANIVLRFVTSSSVTLK